MKYELFSRNVSRNIFSHYDLDSTGRLGYQFGSLWTTPWPDEKDLFLKFDIREIFKFPYENLTFFLGKLHQKFFLFYTLDTHGILNAEFGSIWLTSWPNQKQPYLKFANRQFRNFPYEDLTYFLDKLHQTFF